MFCSQHWLCEHKPEVRYQRVCPVTLCLPPPPPPPPPPAGAPPPRKPQLPAEEEYDLSDVDLDDVFEKTEL